MYPVMAIALVTWSGKNLLGLLWGHLAGLGSVLIDPNFMNLYLKSVLMVQQQGQQLLQVTQG